MEPAPGKSQQVAGLRRGERRVERAAPGHADGPVSRARNAHPTGFSRQPAASVADHRAHRRQT